MNVQLLLVGLLILVQTTHARGFQEKPANPGPDAVDSRLSKYRNIYDKLHPWSPPGSKAAWGKERQAIRERLLVSTGLWPFPDKTDLAPKFGRVMKRDGYTVQHAMFRSMPGHYVTGLLYRPQNSVGKIPGVLCPHGHWQNGRFYDAGEKKAQEQLAKKAEFLPEAARFPLQARFVQLARMGCAVFHYDMVGYADSTAIDHRKDFNDANALLWLTNKMGLQTWNSIRALDFLSSLDEVDQDRLAITGASGGGTQTFMLAAVDDRLAAAFPAVMVSTNMQGGCVCENASYLRIGINNVAIAALFAPKPMAMSGADDWTIDIEAVGLPELRQVYSLYGKSTLVNAKAWPEFKHNYNSHSRHMMYDWFSEHLGLGLEEPPKERGFKPLTKDELTVFASIAKPTDTKGATAVRHDLRESAKKQLDSLLVGDPKTAVARYREVVGAAARVMFGVPRFEKDSIDGGLVDLSRPAAGLKARRRFKNGDLHVYRWAVAGKGGRERPAVVWVSGDGLDKFTTSEGLKSLTEDVRTYGSLLACSYFGHDSQAGELAKIRGDVDKNYGGLTYCYNLPLLSERVRDVATAIQVAEHNNASVTIVATGSAGPIGLLAAAASGVEVERVIVDLNGFSFDQVTSSGDEMMLPGAMRYGDIGGIAALALPSEMDIYGTDGIPSSSLKYLEATARLTGSNVTLHKEPLETAAVSKHLKQSRPGE